MIDRLTDQTFDIKMRFGAISILLRCIDNDLADTLHERYADFIYDGEHDHSILIEIDPEQINENKDLPKMPIHRFEPGKTFIEGRWLRGFYDEIRGYGELILADASPISHIEYYLRSICAIAAFQGGQILLHAAGILRTGYALLFVGHSGSGKSTIVQLSPGSIVLSDDLVLLEPCTDKWIAHGTPFWNPGQAREENTCAIVKSIFTLIKSDHNSIQELKLGRALAEIISNIPIISADPYRNERLLGLGMKLCEDVPVYELSFQKNQSFWSMVDNLL